MTGTVCSEETAQQLSTSAKLDQSVRIILQDSIQIIQSARNYSTYLYCQAEILGKVFNAKGEFYQKRQISSLNNQETVSARWEMRFFLPHSMLYQLMILNGERERLWTLTERRMDEQKDPDKNFGDVEVVNLGSVRAVIERSPLEYMSITHPWYSQPNVAKILEGILRSYRFTMGGETLYTRTNQPIYLIQGELKPELTKEILESRGLNPAGGLFALPGEIPMYVELMIDKMQGLPLQIRFYSLPKDEKTAHDPEKMFNYTIQFEQSHLNDVSLDDSFFEISRGNETIDMTEKYLKDHRSK